MKPQMTDSGSQTVVPYPGNDATSSSARSGDGSTSSGDDISGTVPGKIEVDTDCKRTVIVKNESSSVSVEDKDDDTVYIKITKGEKIVEITM